MNANEVIANRATEILGRQRGSKQVHPNDHVNNVPVSNDVVPRRRLAALLGISEGLIPALDRPRRLAAKAREFDNVVKVGRIPPHGRNTGAPGAGVLGYATQVARGSDRLPVASWSDSAELPRGGTAVGTG